MVQRRARAARTPIPEGFGTIWTAVALDLVGFGIVLPILPIYAERFHARPFTIGLLVASFSLAQFVFAPVWGRVSDRIGRKPVLVLSLAGTAAGSLLTGLAGSLWLLFAGRLIDGLSGASVSVAQASVADIAAPRDRARLLGFLGAAFGIGFVAGPAVGALAALGGAHLPFFVAAGLAAVNAIVAAFRLPETKPAAPEPVAAIAPAARGPLARLLVVAFLSLVAFSGFEATFALFGERRLHLHLASTGAVFTVIGLLIAFVNAGLVHPVVARLGERGALVAGLVANGGGLALLAAVRSWWLFAPAIVLLTVGQGLITPTLSAIVSVIAGSERRGRALGAQQSAGGLARIAGPVLGGLLFDRLGVAWPYLFGAVIVAIAVAVASGVAPKPAAVATAVDQRRP